MRCKYVTSFTSVEIGNLLIHSCNVNGNVVSMASDDYDSGNNPALVFVRDKELKVENFYFFRNKLNNNGKFAKRNENGNKITISLIDCYADTNIDGQWKHDYVKTQNCHFSNPIEKTFPLRQLNLISMVDISIRITIDKVDLLMV